MDALTAIQIWTFDVAVLDMVMPVMGRRRGSDPVRERFPQLPVIIMSGAWVFSVNTAVAETAVAFGVRVLFKPFSIDQLAEAVAAELAGGSEWHEISRPLCLTAVLGSILSTSRRSYRCCGCVMHVGGRTHQAGEHRCSG